MSNRCALARTCASDTASLPCSLRSWFVLSTSVSNAEEKACAISEEVTSAVR